jgi:hypothetical protein
MAQAVRERLTGLNYFGTPEPIVAWPNKKEVHFVPFGHSHMVTIHLTNTHGSKAAKVLGDLGLGLDVWSATIPPRSSQTFGPYLIQSNRSFRGRFRLSTVDGNPANLLVSGYVETW